VLSDDALSDRADGAPPDRHQLLDPRLVFIC
jgi:hypothetical protein